MKSDEIKTTGDLRQVLCQTITGVVNGDVDIAKAREVGKLAAQVNESFYSEMKVAYIQMELGRESADLGLLEMKTGGNLG